MQEDAPSVTRDVQSNQSDIGDREDDAMTYRTDDDPVGDAFRQVLDGSDRDIDIDDDQEDEIVWNPR
jgi:protein SMG7